MTVSACSEAGADISTSRVGVLTSRQWREWYRVKSALFTGFVNGAENNGRSVNVWSVNTDNSREATMMHIISLRVAGTATLTRSIATSTLRWAKQMPPRPPPISEDDITEAFLKGSGPGGQKIVSQWHFYILL